MIYGPQTFVAYCHWLCLRIINSMHTAMRSALDNNNNRTAAAVAAAKQISILVAYLLVSYLIYAISGVLHWQLLKQRDKRTRRQTATSGGQQLKRRNFNCQCIDNFYALFIDQKPIKQKERKKTSKRPKQKRRAKTQPIILSHWQVLYGQMHIFWFWLLVG